MQLFRFFGPLWKGLVPKKQRLKFQPLCFGGSYNCGKSTYFTLALKQPSTRPKFFAVFGVQHNFLGFAVKPESSLVCCFSVAFIFFNGNQDVMLHRRLMGIEIHTRKAIRAASESRRVTPLAYCR